MDHKERLTDQMKEHLLNDDRSFKLYVIEKLDSAPICEKDIVKNNIRWIKGSIAVLYAAIGAGLAKIFFG